MKAMAQQINTSKLALIFSRVEEKRKDKEGFLLNIEGKRIAGQKKDGDKIYYSATFLDDVLYN